MGTEPEAVASSASSVVREKQQTKNERKTMNNQFDELAKGLAQSVTRRAALIKFGVGLMGFALATLGLANKADAAPYPSKKSGKCNHCAYPYGCAPGDTVCLDACAHFCMPPHPGPY